jgi:phosphoglycolate phosphatase
MSTRQIRAVFFDLDGTLIETAQGFQQALWNLGLHPLPFDTMANFLAGVDWRALIDYVFRKEPEKIHQIRIDFEAYYSKHLLDLTTWYPRAQALIQTLKNQGIIVGIISNKDHQLCCSMDQSLHFNVDFLLGSGKVPFKKPHPAPLVEACLAMKVLPRECLYIGDMPTDLEAARWSGMHGVYARYGLHHYFNQQFHAEHEIVNLDDVLPLIDKIYF